MKLRKYTKEQLREAVASSLSIRQTLQKLNVCEAGGNYIVLKRAIAYFNIDNSHFLGPAALKGTTHTRRVRPLEDVLVFGKEENTYRLKSRLITEELKEKQCENCHLSEWLGNSIPLELHHKDGNRRNNEFSNLELLCPNCHALTDNYRGKNKKE